MDEDFGSSYITIEDEEGNEFSFEVIDAADYNDTRYLAVVPYKDAAAEQLDAAIRGLTTESGETPNATDKPETSQKPDATQKPEGEKPAPTGDTNNVMVPVIVVVVCVVALVAVVVVARKRKH